MTSFTSIDSFQDLDSTFFSNMGNVLALQNVEVSDEMDDLSIVCYSRQAEMNYKTDSKTQKCRGLVYDSEKKLISQAFGYTPMFTLKDVSWSSDETFEAPDYSDISGGFEYLPNEIRTYINDNIANCKIFTSIEGCLVRVFNHSGKWYLTTHRKLDAFKSYWGSRTSFGQMFLNCLETARKTDALFAEKCPQDTLLESFFALLNPARQYVFLVSNNSENRIVCTPAENQYAIHVATFENGVEVDEKIVGIAGQSPIQNLDNFSDLTDYIHSLDPRKYQGVVVFLPSGKQLKICSPRYMSLYNLRGNEASVMYRYLQVRMFYPEDFKNLYPEFSSRFVEYENALIEVSKSILKSYQQRFISHITTVVPKEQFMVMSTVHTNFKKSCQEGNRMKVDLNEVQRVLNQQPPTSLNKMIRQYLIESRKNVV